MTMQSDDLGLVERLRGEIEFVQGDAAAWGVDAYGDLPRTLALLSEAAAALEAKDAEIERLVAERDEARAEATEWANRSLEAVGSLRTERDEAQETIGRGILRLPAGTRADGLLEGISDLRRRAEAAEAQRDKLKEALLAMVQRFELYLGPDNIHAGHHDLALVELGRQALKDAP